MVMNVDLDRNEEMRVPRACLCYLTSLPSTKLMSLENRDSARAQSNVVSGCLSAPLQHEG